MRARGMVGNVEVEFDVPKEYEGVLLGDLWGISIRPEPAALCPMRGSAGPADEESAAQKCAREGHLFHNGTCSRCWVQEDQCG